MLRLLEPETHVGDYLLLHPSEIEPNFVFKLIIDEEIITKALDHLRLVQAAARARQQVDDVLPRVDALSSLVLHPSSTRLRHSRSHLRLASVVDLVVVRKAPRVAAATRGLLCPSITPASRRGG